MTFEEFVKKYNIRLNKAQMEAVKSVEGPCLLLAVPGSGKTTVLVTRLGYMIYCLGIDPKRILTLTYTVAATKDMGERFCKFFGRELADLLEFRTINGICARIINFYSRKIGRSSFSLCAEETPGFLTAIYQQVTNDYPTESDLKGVRTMITYIKNMMLSPKEISALDETLDYSISEIYRIYQAEMRRQGLMDYDDQMIYALNILLRDRDTLSYFQQMYQYICVDEAQDTSKIQHKIISLLASDNENLFMVGDEDQSIYGFRAAYPEALLHFEKEHRGAKVLLMEENFRSCKRIVTQADHFIQKNEMRHKKHMYPNRQNEGRVVVRSLKSRSDQYIDILAAATTARETTAILYRDNESAIPLVDLFDRKGISYRMRGGDLMFFSHKLVRDVVNIIRFAINPKDAEAFMQIYYKIKLYINKPMAIAACNKAAVSGNSIMSELIYQKGLPKYRRDNLKEVEKNLRFLAGGSGGFLLHYIERNLGYGEYLDKAKMRKDKLFILDAIASKTHSAMSFLRRLEALADLIKNHENDPNAMVVLSTMHGSKGLEYPHVHLLDVIDGIFPLATREELADMDVDIDYEEERRIFYVAITRAKDELVAYSLGPGMSSFVEEIREKRPVEIPVRKIFGKAKEDKKRFINPQEKTSYLIKKPMETRPFVLAEYQAMSDQMRIGARIVHKSFGEGIVVKNETDHVTIEFPDRRRVFVKRNLYEKNLVSFPGT